ncbi:MAG: hypothetical protein AAGK22_00430 [Acidobacteriota bacterium]
MNQQTNPSESVRTLPTRNSRARLLAWHSRDPLTQAEVAHRIAGVENFSPMAGMVRHELTLPRGHAGLVAWEPDLRGRRALCASSERGVVAATRPPYGLSQIIPWKGELGAPEIERLMTALIDDPRGVARLNPPFCIAGAELERGIDVFNDMRGLIDLYALPTTASGFTAWGSDPYLPLVFALEAPVEDRQAAALRAFWSYYPQEHSPFVNTPRVAGGTHVFLADRAEAPAVERRALLDDLLSESFEMGFDPAAAEEELLSTTETCLREGRALFEGKVTMGLSGGRDSRLLLASLLKSKTQDGVSMFTRTTMGGDQEFGTKVAHAAREAGFEIDWRAVPGRRPAFSADSDDLAFDFLPSCRRRSDYGTNPLLDRYVFAFHIKNGQTMPGGYFGAPTARLDTVQRTLGLSGVSGEVLRAARYKESDLSRPPQKFFDRFAKRKFGAGVRFRRRVTPTRPFNEPTLDLAHQSWNLYISRAEEIGIGGFHRFDYFAINAQQSRRIQSPANVVAPLAGPALMARAFGMSAEDRIANRYHLELTERMHPWLATIPYTHQVPVPASEKRRDNSGMPTLYSEKGIAGFGQILEQPGLWEDVYDPDAIRTIFDRQTAVNPYQMDRFSCLLAWRVAHRRYSEILDAFIRDHRNASTRD